MLITAWFCKSQVPPRNIRVPVEAGAGEVQAGLAEQGPPGWFCRGCSGAAGWGSGDVAGWGSLSPSSPGAEMRGFLTHLLLDLCHCCSRSIRLSRPPQHQLSWLSSNRWSLRQSSPRFRQRNYQVHKMNFNIPHLKTKKKKSKKADFLFAALKEAFCNLRNSGPGLLFSHAKTCSFSPGWRRNWH